MNLIARVLWILLNVLFGASLAYILFIWVACDMEIPSFLMDFLDEYIPAIKPIFQVPYIKINQISSSISSKLLFNAFLYAIFGFIHTLFAQEFVQSFLGHFLFPKQTLRTVYNLLVTITVFIIIGFWQHTEVQLWNFLPNTMTKYQQHMLLLMIHTIFHVPGLSVVFKFNPFEFAGITQLFSNMKHPTCPFKTSISTTERTTGTATLVTTGLFRFCRHPLYLFTLLAWTVTPVMSLDRLAIIIYTCIYASIGVPIEERKLIQIFGKSYIDYQRRVPAIIPFTKPKAKRN